MVLVRPLQERGRLAASTSYAAFDAKSVTSRSKTCMNVDSDIQLFNALHLPGNGSGSFYSLEFGRCSCTIRVSSSRAAALVLLLWPPPLLRICSRGGLGPFASGTAHVKLNHLQGSTVNVGRMVIEVGQTSASYKAEERGVPCAGSGVVTSSILPRCIVLRAFQGLLQCRLPPCIGSIICQR